MQFDKRLQSIGTPVKPQRRIAAATAMPGALGWLNPKLALQDFKRSFKAPADAPTPLGRLGSLEVRLAQKKGDVKRAQKLRFRVFYEDGPAIPDALTKLSRRDRDAFDAVCDHLMVIDHAAKPLRSGRQAVVGTYRLLRQEVAESCGGFYTEDEFDIARLLDRHRDLQFMELGRSCVLPAYRDKRTVELLWHGIWNYVVRHRIDVMIGCASFGGTDPDRLALPLSFLHHHAAAPDAWQARARTDRYVDMNRIGRDAIDIKAALRQLPPLIKAYLRLGAYVGDGAVIDHRFGTTDVLIVMPVADIGARYIKHFGDSAFDAGSRAASGN